MELFRPVLQVRRGQPLVGRVPVEGGDAVGPSPHENLYLFAEALRKGFINSTDV